MKVEHTGFVFYKLDWDVKEESVMMIPRFLVCATGRMELPFIDIGKAAEEHNWRKDHGFHLALKFEMSVRHSNRVAR